MRNIKLTIEYDGSNYFGWQRQPQGATIQEVLEGALEKITGDRVTVVGSGRTDSGVHALAQVANFKTESKMTSFQLQNALNSLLPKDIVIKRAEDVDLNFHSQFSARSKVYTYMILNRGYPSALERLRAWFIRDHLNLSRMEEAARTVIGEHDFRGFALSKLNVKTTMRRVLSAELNEKPDGRIEFEIEATGFLKGMVRLIVGTLVQVGKGRITPEDFRRILESGEKTNFAITAPARGLFLKEIRY